MIDFKGRRNPSRLQFFNLGVGSVSIQSQKPSIPLNNVDPSFEWNNCRMEIMINFDVVQFKV